MQSNGQQGILAIFCARVSVQEKTRKLEFYNQGLTETAAKNWHITLFIRVGFPNKTGTDLEPIA